VAMRGRGERDDRGRDGSSLRRWSWQLAVTAAAEPLASASEVGWAGRFVLDRTDRWGVSVLWASVVWAWREPLR
jgi:hypothetical protein